MKAVAKLALRNILLDIDDETKPVRMSKSEAIEFLEELHAGLEARIEALREEIERGG
jgi:prefoldin subunit 5